MNLKNRHKEVVMPFLSLDFGVDGMARAVAAILQPRGELAAALRMAEQRDGRNWVLNDTVHLLN